MDFNSFYNEKAEYYSGGYTKGIERVLNNNNVVRGSALDIGAGQGRNSFYLADQDFVVDAVEPSENGCAFINTNAKKFNKNITAYVSNFLSFKTNKKYDFIIAITSLDHMTSEDVIKSVEKIKNLLNKGGYVYITVFTELDPGNHKDSGVAYSETGIFIKHYFKLQELKNFFSDFNILSYTEEYSLDESHGKPHTHHTAKLAAQF